MKPENYVECQHCRAKVGRSRLRRIALASMPAVYRTFCPVCNGLISSYKEDSELWHINTSKCENKYKHNDPGGDMWTITRRRSIGKWLANPTKI